MPVLCAHGGLSAHGFRWFGASGITVRHTSPGSGTETIPAGYTTMMIEVIGAGGGGSKGVGTGMAAAYGGDGASGALARSTYTITGHSGQTISWTVGSGGTGGSGGTAATDGTSSAATSGTFSITAMSGGPGTHGTVSTGGTGGSGSGGNLANLTGPAGGVDDGVFPTPLPSLYGGSYGGGGAAGYTSSGAGFSGGNGAVIFHYS